MEVTVALVVTAITLVAGKITKMTRIPNRYIPLQNIIIAIIASIVCIIFKVQNMSPFDTIIICIISTMSAGGISDITKIVDKD